MNGFDFTLSGCPLTALASGALWWPEQRMLVVSDLHLGKSERTARRDGTLLPPYETRDALYRLEAAIDQTSAGTVICLGDSFDDIRASQSLTDDDALWITRLQAGRRWVWVEGNHDPAPPAFGGTHLAELPAPPLILRHIARPGTCGEVSGHYHPKASVSVHGRTITRPCFLIDSERVILPAFGTYTGGLRSTDTAFHALMDTTAVAVMTGPTPQVIPMPR